MSTTVTSTAAPEHWRTGHDKRGVIPKSLKNLTGDVLDESGIGWLRESSATTSIEDTRKRYLEDGYVFLKNFIPRDDVLDVREE
jgi:phytanoyl-CoA hydroxylase